MKKQKKMMVMNVKMHNTYEKTSMRMHNNCYHGSTHNYYAK